MDQNKRQQEIAQRLLERKKEQEALNSQRDPSLIFIDEKELSQILCVALGTLRRQRWSGDGIKFYKFSGAVRYRMADVLAHIEASARTSTSEVL